MHGQRKRVGVLSPANQRTLVDEALIIVQLTLSLSLVPSYGIVHDQFVLVPNLRALLPYGCINHSYLVRELINESTAVYHDAVGTAYSAISRRFS